MQHETEHEYAKRITNEVQRLAHRDDQKKWTQKLIMDRYASDLKNQIENQKIKKLKDNEMDPREKMINIGGLIAYQEGQLNPGHKVVPGYEKNTKSYIGSYNFGRG